MATSTKEIRSAYAYLSQVSDVMIHHASAIMADTNAEEHERAIAVAGFDIGKNIQSMVRKYEGTMKQ